MNDTVVIYAHPNKDGHCGFYLQELKRELDSSKEPYEVLDLYDLGYDPVLKTDEHYASGHKNITQQNKEIQEKIKGAQRLIFIYPTWWQNMPAILKGFVDRVFVTGFAFYYKNSLPKGLLQGKRAAVFTSSGAPRFINRYFTGDRALKVLVKDTLGFCGVTAKGFAVGSAQELTAKNKALITATVRNGMAFLLK